MLATPNLNKHTLHLPKCRWLRCSVCWTEAWILRRGSSTMLQSHETVTWAGFHPPDTSLLQPGVMGWSASQDPRLSTLIKIKLFLLKLIWRGFGPMWNRAFFFLAFKCLSYKDTGDIWIHHQEYKQSQRTQICPQNKLQKGRIKLA